VKAVVAEELSGPSGLAYRDVDDIPDRVDGAVVIDVRAAGVCYPDLLVIRGEYQMKAPPPFIPGSEVAGVVRSAPEDSDLEPGDRVAAATMHGGYAERIAVAPDSVVRTPPGLDDAQAAALLRNYYTMYFRVGAAWRPPSRGDGPGARVGRWCRVGRGTDRKGVGRRRGDAVD
jgi:NADPH:quinone reductase